MHPHHYTLENSRSGTGIATAWIVLQRLGIEGFQAYLLHMLTIGEDFRRAINKLHAQSFFVVNPETKGFEVVIKINFFEDRRTWNEMLVADKITQKIYIEHCNNFKNYIYTDAIKKYPECPLIGFVPQYKKSSADECLPSFLIYPMSVFTTRQTICKSLHTLSLVKLEYEKLIKNNDNVAFKTMCALPPR